MKLTDAQRTIGVAVWIAINRVFGPPAEVPSPPFVIIHASGSHLPLPKIENKS